MLVLINIYCYYLQMYILLNIQYNMYLKKLKTKHYLLILIFKIIMSHNLELPVYLAYQQQ